MMRLPRLATAWVLVLLAGPFSALQGQQDTVAPDSAQTPVQELVLETRALLSSIESDTAALGDLRRQGEGLTGEELRVIERRLTRASIDVLARIGSLVRNIVEIEGNGGDAAEFRVPVESMLQSVDARAHSRADELNDAMHALMSEREEATPEQLIGIEARLAQREADLNTILVATLDNIENLERLGLPADEQRAHLAEVLGERADAAIARADLAQSQAASIQGRLARSPDDADLKLALEAAQARTRRVTEGLASTIAMMRRLGLDATEYQLALIQATGRITTDIFDSGVAVGLIKQAYSSFKDRLVERGPRGLFQALLILLILLITHVVAKWVQSIVKGAVSAPRLELSRLLQNTLVSMSGGVVRVVGVLIAFSQLGFSLAPLLAGVGIVGFIVGFALQDTLANFAAGMMILIYRPFDVGDVVEAAGASGKVSKMSLVSTTILTFDNQALVVPNGKIWGDVIKNVTAQRVRRVDLTFGIGYDDDIPKTETVLKEILEAHPKVLSTPEPTIRLHNLGESSIDFVVRPWVKTDDYWDVYWDLTREVKMRFDREGISIPFPQRDVHLHEVPRAPDPVD